MQAWRSAEGTSMANNRQRILDFYDRAWHPLVAEYYGHSDYMNYGYWTGGKQRHRQRRARAWLASCSR